VSVTCRTRPVTDRGSAIVRGMFFFGDYKKIGSVEANVALLFQERLLERKDCLICCRREGGSNK